MTIETLVQERDSVRKQFTRKTEGAHTKMEDLNEKLNASEKEKDYWKNKSEELLAEKNLIEEEFLVLQKYVKTQSNLASIGINIEQACTRDCEAQEESNFELLENNQLLQFEYENFEEKFNGLKKKYQTKSLESSLNRMTSNDARRSSRLSGCKRR